MATWRCPNCEAVLRDGKQGPAAVTYTPRRDEAGRIVRDRRSRRPKFDAHCLACGALAHP